jgi:hypothetical protein
VTPGPLSYLQYGAVLFICVVMVGGFASYWSVQRHKIGVPADHAAEEHHDRLQ